MMQDLRTLLLGAARLELEATLKTDLLAIARRRVPCIGLSGLTGEHAQVDLLLDFQKRFPYLQEPFYSQMLRESLRRVVQDRETRDELLAIWEASQQENRA